MTAETPTSPPGSPSGSESDGGLKAVLWHYLRGSRQDLRWKLEGLSERQLRMPMTPTGTNLLGVLKHVSSVEVGYFTDCFARPSGIAMPWFDDDAEPNADMYATAEESVDDILDLADKCAAASDAAIADLSLDDVATVPWWGQRRVTLGRLLVHMVAEYGRHLGQVDIVRELLDGQAGLSPSAPNLPAEAQGVDATWWQEHRQRLQRIAEAAPE
ncbi:DinB family protein [Tessaracoccus sp. OS52]|uniref:DinB family protein n=1 Tax=Tessaracoccus sp. OS52 TaxID=2886691 RepID=UPI001D122100|nr:DinB family protein [Tessaracoccus sp. OS52]MCC2591890.1 DinB family protein [Tessaracoccus sp. OS52]